MTLPVVSLDWSRDSYEEADSGSTERKVYVYLDGSSETPVVVSYTTVDGTASAGADYTAQTGTVTFAPGETSAIITIQTLADTDYEANESFEVRITGVSDNATIAETGSSTSVEIWNDDPLPSVTLSPASPVVVEGDSGSKALTFTARLAAPAMAPFSLIYEASQGTATYPYDFGFTFGFLRFETGDTEATFIVNITGDTVYEPEETFTVRVGEAEAVVTIQDNDPPPPSVALLSTVTSVTEGDAGTTDLTFTVQLSQVMPGVVYVDYGTLADTAQVDLDYNRWFGTFRFEPGETSKSFTVSVRGDTLHEGDESFFVRLGNPTGGVVLDSAHRSATVTILDDDPAPTTLLSLAATLDDRTEGTGDGVSVFSYLVTRSGDLSGNSQVGWSVSGSGANAANAADFLGGVLPSGTLTFAAGQAEQVIKVRVLRDAVFEPDQTFQVALSAPVGASLGISQASGIIRNDDAPSGTLAIAGEITDRSEGTGDGVSVFTYRMTRTGDLSETMQAGWSVRGTGVNPADAADFLGGVLPSGVVTFAAGQAEQTIKVRVLRDAVQESDEGFSVILAAPSTPGIRVISGVANGIIRNDDLPSVRFAMTTDMVDRDEGTGSGVSVFSYTVTRSGDLSGTSHVDWIVLGAPPYGADAADFLGGALPKGRVTFEAGQAEQVIKVRVLRDAEEEPDSYFHLLAKSAEDFSYTMSARGVIRDDDAPPRTNLSIGGDVTERSEGTGTGVSVFSYIVTRSGDLSGASQAAWSVRGTGASAADAADFMGGVMPGGTVAFAAGEASQVIKLRVLRDAQQEADETFVVTLGSLSSGTAITSATATGTILNDDLAPSFMALSDHMLIG
ncbi:Calx-beta domain-containing protein [Roseomonas sp. F4]